MEPLGLSIHRLARELRVPPTRVSEIVNERRAITADTALRLARYFRSKPEFWMNLQARYEVLMAEHEAAEELAKIVPFDQRAA